MIRSRFGMNVARTWVAALTAVLALSLAGRPALAGEAAGKDIVDTAAAAGSFKTLLAATQAADLVGALKGKGPLTVFAPTDEAFAKLPKGTVEALLKPENKARLQNILLFHVVPGSVKAADVVKLKSAKTLQGQEVAISVKEGVKVGSATVTATDVLASNGVIHVIDSVILPKDLVDVAAGAGSFKTLVAAIQAAGLEETLRTGGPFTVFAPTDAAFAKLPAGTIEDLLKPENKAKLQAILTYHVVPGAVKAADVVKVSSAPTVQGQALTITVKDKAVLVNNATVTATDIPALNGVIHVIDTVVLPK